MTQLLFSIVIPTFNRPAQLTTCLQSIVELEYPCNRFEVIVVNDGGTDSLDSVITPIQKSLNLKLVTQANAGPASARNAGATHAQGKFLVFTDDDCTMLPNYLSVLESYLLKMPECLVGGHTLNALPHNIFSAASQTLIDYLYEYYNRDLSRSNFFASNNFALSLDRFQTLGGFNTTFSLAAGEDREFCDRWLHQGHSMIYAPEVQIYHAHDLTFSRFWEQHFNYGRGAFCYHQARAQYRQMKVKIEPFRFYFNLLRFPLHQPCEQSALVLALLLFLSQIANIAGFFLEKRRHSFPSHALKIFQE
jgi:glycosyltransferase involved in cell wall biosynthesis